MKLSIIMKLINTIILILFFQTFDVDGSSPTLERSKKLEESFTVSDQSQISLENARGNIKIENIDGNEGRVELLITVRSEDENEIQKVFDKIELNVSKNGDYIDIEADDNIQTWNKYKISLIFVIKETNTIRFTNGEKAYDIEDINIEMKLYLPKVESVKAENKYHDVIYDQMNCDLEVVMHSGKLRGQDIAGDLTLDMKYGETRIGNFENGEIHIFDSEFTSGNTGELEFESKYSEVEVGDMESLDLISFDDEFEFGDIKNDLEIKAKYTEFEIKSFGEGKMDLFDSKLEAINGTSLELKSKYSDLEFGILGSADLTLFDDKVTIDELNGLNVEESKYAEIYITTFNGDMDIESSHDDIIKVSKVGSEFSGLRVNAKYSDIDFPIPASLGYLLEAEMKYGDFDLPTSFEAERRIKDDGDLDLLGFVNGGNAASPKVNINSYDGNVDLGN